MRTGVGQPTAVVAVDDHVRARRRISVPVRSGHSQGADGLFARSRSHRARVRAGGLDLQVVTELERHGAGRPRGSRHRGTTRTTPPGADPGHAQPGEGLSDMLQSAPHRVQRPGVLRGAQSVRPSSAPARGDLDRRSQTCSIHRRRPARAMHEGLCPSASSWSGPASAACAPSSGCGIAVTGVSSCCSAPSGTRPTTDLRCPSTCCAENVAQPGCEPTTTSVRCGSPCAWAPPPPAFPSRGRRCSLTTAPSTTTLLSSRPGRGRGAFRVSGAVCCGRSMTPSI